MATARWMRPSIRARMTPSSPWRCSRMGRSWSEATSTSWAAVETAAASATTSAASTPMTRSMTSTPGTNGKVLTLVVEPEHGRILAGGDFTLLGGGSSPTQGTTRLHLGELNPDGSLTNFGSGDGANNRVSALAVQVDGKVVVGGEFSSLGLGGGLTGSAPRSLIGRLHADGSLDPGFNPGAGPSAFGGVQAIAVQIDRRIVVGGLFWSLGGGGRPPQRGWLGRQVVRSRRECTPRYTRGADRRESRRRR